MSKKIKQLAKETVIYGLSNILSRLLNFVVVARYLTEKFNDDLAEYGKHGIMYAYAALLLVVMTYGMETAFFRFGNKKENRAAAFSTAAISLIISTVFFVGILMISSRPIAGALLEESNWNFVILFAAIIGFDVISAIPFARLRLENRPLRFAFYKFLNVVVNFGAMLFFLELLPYLMQHGQAWAANFYNHEGRLTFVFLANLIASIATFLMLLPIYFGKFSSIKTSSEVDTPRPAFRFDKELWKKMIRYSLPLVVVGFAGMINQMADKYLPKLLLPATWTYDQKMEEIGIYVAVAKIAILMSLFTQAFKFAAEPFFFRHAGEGGSKKLYAQTAQAFTLVACLFFLGVLLYLDIIQYLIASNFRAGLNIVPILLMAYLFLGIYHNISIWYKLTDKTKFGAYVSLTGVVITLSLNFTLIPMFGTIGAAWSTLGCFFAMTVIVYLLGQRHFPVPYPILKMFLYVLFALAIYFISIWLRPNMEENLVQILLMNTGLMLGYLAGIGLLERKVVRTFLRQRR